MIDQELLTSVIRDLKTWFPPELHRERELKGGGKWFFVPWQAIRDRLDEVVPSWECAYTSPMYLDKYCVVTCSITILGITRQAIGNAEIELLSNSGKDMSRGTSIERAIADAFKNAAEAWGIARYLDEQTDPNAKADFIRYMQKSGDGRAAAWHHQGDAPSKPQNNPQAKPFGGKPTVRQAVQPVAPAIAKPEEALQEEPEPSEVPFMDGVNQMLNSLDSIERCRQFYQWISDRAVWKQVNEVPATASYVKQELAKAIGKFAPDDLSQARMLADIEIGRLGWDSAKTQDTLYARYGKRSRSELAVSELYLFLWHLKGQQQLSLQGVG